jgi:hypothetical protein
VGIRILSWTSAIADNRCGRRGFKFNFQRLRFRSRNDSAVSQRPVVKLIPIILEAAPRRLIEHFLSNSWLWDGTTDRTDPGHKRIFQP